MACPTAGQERHNARRSPTPAQQPRAASVEVTTLAISMAASSITQHIGNISGRAFATGHRPPTQPQRVPRGRSCRVADRMAAMARLMASQLPRRTASHVHSVRPGKSIVHRSSRQAIDRGAPRPPEWMQIARCGQLIRTNHCTKVVMFAPTLARPSRVHQN
jgi:hypothetical protein